MIKDAFKLFLKTFLQKPDAYEHPKDPTILIARNPAAFRLINDPQIRSIIWKRPINFKLNDALQALNYEEMEAITFSLPLYQGFKTEKNEAYYRAVQLLSSHILECEIGLSCIFRAVVGESPKARMITHSEDFDPYEWHVDGDNIRFLVPLYGKGSLFLPGIKAPQGNISLQTLSDHFKIQNPDSICDELMLNEVMLFKGGDEYGFVHTSPKITPRSHRKVLALSNNFF